MSVQVQLITKIVRDGKVNLLEAQQRGITSAHFEGEGREIYEFITTYAMNYNNVPSVERFKEEFPSFKFENPHAPITELIERLIKSAQERYLSKRIIEIADMIGDGKAEEAIDLFQGTSSELNSLAQPGNVTRFSSAASRFKSYKKKAKENENPFGLRIGIDAIDEAFMGIQSGDFFVVTGRLEIGKSTFAKAFAASFWRQNKVTLILSFEMKASLYLQSLDAMIAKISYQRMRKMALAPTELKKWKKMLDRVSSKEADIIVVDGIRRPTPETVSTYIDIYNPDVVILDQLPLMRPNTSDKGKATWEMMMLLSRQLKGVSQIKDTPIIGLTQASREAVTKGVSIETVGYSDAIMQDADKAIGIDRGPEENQRTVPVLKNRDLGVKVRAHVEFDPETMQFKTLSSEKI